MALKHTNRDDQALSMRELTDDELSVATGGDDLGIVIGDPTSGGSLDDLDARAHIIKVG